MDRNTYIDIMEFKNFCLTRKKKDTFRNFIAWKELYKNKNVQEPVKESVQEPVKIEKPKTKAERKEVFKIKFRNLIFEDPTILEEALKIADDEIMNIKVKMILGEI